MPARSKERNGKERIEREEKDEPEYRMCRHCPSGKLDCFVLQQTYSTPVCVCAFGRASARVCVRL